MIGRTLLLSLALLAGCRHESRFDGGGSGGRDDAGRDSGPADVSKPADVPAPTDLREAGGADAARDSAAGEAFRLRIATWNVWRFFDAICDSGRCDEGDWEERPSAAEFGARADQIALGVRALDADLVLLQEVETQTALDAVADRLGDGWETNLVGETGAPGSVDVAVLARVASGDVVSHRSRPLRRPDGSETYFSREFLEVHFAVEGREVIVFTAHFRSKVDDDPGRRLAEAQAAAAIVSSAARDHPTALVVMGGDLNDVPGSPPLDVLEDVGGLQRVASDLDSPGTYRWNGELIELDHLLLAPGPAAAYVAHSARVARDASGGYRGSDHAALRADFVVYE